MVRRLAILIICAFAFPVSGAGAWTWPVDGPVLRPFSFDHAHPYAGGQHRGVDLGAPSGSAVLAPAEGVVSFAGTVPTGGKTVSIQTPFGYTATLVHLGSIGVTRGALVGEASVVGTVGPSGAVELTEPYVYFGARVTSDPQGYVDPLALLPPRVAPKPAGPAPVADVASSQAAESSQAGTAPQVTAPTAAVSAEPAAQTPAPVPSEHPTTADAPAVAAAPVAASVVEAPQVQLTTAEPTALAIKSTPQNTVGHAEVGPASPESVTTEIGQRPAGGSEWSRAHQANPESPFRLEDASSLRLHREPRTVSVARTSARDGAHDWSLPAVGFAALTVAVGLMLAFRRRSTGEAARIMILPRAEQVLGRTATETEDLGGAGLALRSREEASGPRGRLRSARGHLRAVPQAEGQRRPDGERDRRARYAGDGYGGPRRRLAA
jgi:hypothetical protein